MAWNANYYIYLMTNTNNKVLYIGVTNNLKRRVSEHKTCVNDGFTKRYNIHKLIYFEHFTSINSAIKREKQLKKWNRLWKNELVERENPKWDDLYEEI
ncbi:MAG: GIY-YIG nuclease family protein [Bacteroidales bacterium]|nr:GIY-YIG nuclease family protein [Bacteroidales bacterium]